MQLPDAQVCLAPQSASVQQAVLGMQALPHLRVVELQVKSHEVPLQVAVPLTGCGHAVHDVPQLAVLVFNRHVPLQL